MTKTLSMVSHKNYNLNAKWGFCHFLISKLSTCFINGFTSRRKSQSIACLLNGSEHIYWILDLETEVHSIWVIWTQCSATGQSYRARKLPAGVGCGENQASSLAHRSHLILPYRGFSVLLPFSAFWLRSSVVSVLISLISDTRLIEPHDINLIFIGCSLTWQLAVRGCECRYGIALPPWQAQPSLRGPNQPKSDA